MVALVVLAVVAAWCLLSIAVGLTVCRGISWARGLDPADEPTPIPAPSSPEARPAISLPAPRSADVVLDLTTAEAQLEH